MLFRSQLTVRRSLDNESNEVIAPKHNKARTVPLSPGIASALAKLPKRGLWVIAADDGGSIDYDRAGGLLAAVTGLYALADVARPPQRSGAGKDARGGGAGAPARGW